MKLEEAREIGKIRQEIKKSLPEVRKEQLVESLTPVIKELKIVTFPEIQKIEGKTEAEVSNWPNIFKVVGEVIAKVAFPPIQKIVGSVAAKVENWPIVQKIAGAVTAKVENFPEVQKVQVTNPIQRMYIEGQTEVTNLPLGKSDTEGNPERFVAVRFTDGKRYYDLTELTVTGGGMTGTQYQDPDTRWIREDITYNVSNDPTRSVAYDGKGNKKTVDYEYDANNNCTRKTVRVEAV